MFSAAAAAAAAAGAAAAAAAVAGLHATLLRVAAVCTPERNSAEVVLRSPDQCS